jgi:hypothetical protein
MTRSNYFETLLDMFEQHIQATEIRTEYEIQEKILTFIEENNVPEPDYEGDYLGDGNFADNH